MDEPTARDHIRKALEQANDSQRPITCPFEFTEFVKEFYLPLGVYKKYFRIVVEMWDEYQIHKYHNASLPTPSESGASDAPRDNPNHLPVLDPEAEPETLFIMAQTYNPKFAYASYKTCSTPGSYIRADAVRDNNLEAREDGLVEVQWKLTGKRGISDDRRIPHTACRIVSEEEAESMNMDVDLVLGTDFQKELKLQAFVAEVHRGPEEPGSVRERRVPGLDDTSGRWTSVDANA